MTRTSARRSASGTANVPLSRGWQRLALRDGQKGFTMLELLVALAITLALCGGLLVFVRLAAAAIRTQPERADVQQRLRSAVETVVGRIEHAGAGPAAGGGTVPFAGRVPVIFPQRRGGTGADAPMSAFQDRVTVYAVPEGGVLAALAQDVSTTLAPLVLAPTPGCPLASPTCRFAVGDTVLVFDATGTHEIVSITGIGPDTLQHTAAVSKLYRTAMGAAVVSVDVRSIVFDAGASQLRIQSPSGMNQPLADNVVEFAMSYYGQTRAPAVPRPPPGEDGCLVDTAGVPKLPALNPDWGALVQLQPGALSDGPACGSGAAAFDVDLFRVRQVRVSLRVQAGAASYRGRWAAWFRRPGPQDDVRMMVPDGEVTVDVVLRHLAGGS